MARNCGDNSCGHEMGIVKGTLVGLNSAINEHQNRMDKIDDILLSHLNELKELERRIEKRLDELERKQFAIYAIAGFVGIVASLATKVFM